MRLRVVQVGRLQERRVAVGLCALALLGALAGCRSFAPPQPRTVEEIYYEALAANKPEETLGMDYPANGVYPSEHTYPETGPSPSPLGSPQPLLAPAAKPLDPSQHGTAQPPPTGIRTIAAETGHQLVSDIYTDTDVREAIQALATQAGVSIVMDDMVRGNVNCTIEKEPFEQALQRILLPMGFVYKKKGNLFLIGATDPASNLFPHIATSVEFRPHHLSAQELIALLPPRQSQFVRTVEKRNLIVIEAPEEIARNIHAQLSSADTPIPQIVIEAVVCVVAPDKGLQFGMDWNQFLKVEGFDALNVGMAGLAFTGQVSPHGAKSAFSDFAVTSAFVKLLAKEGYVTIRAAPRVMAKDGEKAEISIARDTFFSVQQGGNQFTLRQDIEKVESGISLILTPSIRGENVQIQIEKAEVSEDVRTSDPDQQLINNPFPLINRRRVTTTVQVKDRQTIVIGGLVQRQTIDRELRIPYLGALPGVGNMFRRIEKQEQDAEVVIFISPKIVVPTAAAPAYALPVEGVPVEGGLEVPELVPAPPAIPPVESIPVPMATVPLPAPVASAPAVVAPVPAVSGPVVPQLRVLPPAHGD